MANPETHGRGQEGDQSETGRRRVRVIMFLDMAGFSAVMSRSESRAMESVNAIERILKEEVPSEGGRLVKFMGDGSMSVFRTATGAVRCGRKILGRIAEVNATLPAGERAQVRIGIHMGEVLVRENDVFGDTVNIAARVQATAEPGELAMTEAILAQVRNQMPLRGAHSRFTRLKNIPGFIHVFYAAPEGPGYPAWLLHKKRRFLGLAVGAVFLAGLLMWGFQWAPRTVTVAPGTLIEGWEITGDRYLSWLPWDETVIADTETHLRTEGKQSIKMNFDTSRYNWPVLIGSAKIGLDLRRVKGVSVDIYLPPRLAGRLHFRMVFSGARPPGKSGKDEKGVSSDLANLELHGGWNHVEYNLPSASVPPVILRGVFEIMLMFEAVKSPVSGWLVLDNFRMK